MIFAIDPGNEQSAYVLWDEKKESLTSFAKLPNETLYEQIPSFRQQSDICCIEMLAAYGQIGRTVLDTCVWVGLFMGLYGKDKVELIFRKSIVTGLTGNPRANDSTIRTTLISRYGNGNTRTKQKGTLLEGVSADMWQALALAVYKSDQLTKRVWAGSSDFIVKT